MEKIRDKVVTKAKSDKKEEKAKTVKEPKQSNAQEEPKEKKRLPAFTKEKADMRQNELEVKPAAVAKPEPSMAKIPAQIGWAKLEAKQEKLISQKSSEAAKVSTA